MKMTSARWLKSAIAVVLVGLAATGCAALRPAASLRLPYKAPQRAVHAQSRPIFASKQLVNCVESTGTPCNTTANPGNGTQGMPAWQAFGALNSDVSELYGMFGASSHLASTGSAIAGDIVGLFALPPPVQSAPATATAGGTLAAATYYYVVTATDASGETTASNELSIATTGTTSENTISWAAVSGATGYRVYRGTAPGAENTYYAVSGGSTTSFLDTGAAGTTGSAPATDTAACSGTEYLGADGFCYASGTGTGSGTVSDGSGTTTANEVALSTTGAHVIGYATTLPASAMPAVSGDVTIPAGTTTATVSKVNGASLPASAGLLGTNASSQIIAAPASGVTAGSYTSANITVNAQGQITAASNGTASSGSITPGTTTVNGATAPCLIDNSTGTTMGCAAIGGGLSLNNGTLGTSAPSRTVTTSPTVASTDMAGAIFMNVTGGGTLTIPAISSTVFAARESLVVVNYSASTATVSTTPTINAGGGCVSGTGIPAGDTWNLLSNGTTLDCVQTVSSSNGSMVYPSAGFGVSTGGAWASTAIAVSGCTPSASALGLTAATITQPATPCTTATFTFSVTAAHGWLCSLQDVTLTGAGTYVPAVGQSNTTPSTTSCTVTIPTDMRTAADILSVAGTPY